MNNLFFFLACNQRHRGNWVRIHCY